MRRHFALPEDDQDFIESLGRPWETIRDLGGQWLLIHDFPLPPGFNCNAASVAIAIPAGFPTAALDMAYFLPFLSRLDRVPIKQIQVTQMINQHPWQRWSRHYAWRPGIDCLATHVAHIENWLKHALGLQA